MSKYQAVFLGTGTSQGVPVIACNCEVCTSNNPKDIRTRTSLMLRIDDVNIVIDTGPDFREQMLRENVQHLEGIVFTHAHKDHIAGLDDIRAFNYRAKKPMEIFATKETLEGIKREFHYVFADYKYPGVPQVDVQIIDDSKFEVQGIPFTPINVIHYKLPVKAFRIKDLTYITDANYISDEEMAKIQGSKVLIINALRKEEHISHFTLEQALAIIKMIKPNKAYLTHISHLMGKHDQVEELLPDNVQIAYDGLQIDFE